MAAISFWMKNKSKSNRRGQIEEEERREESSESIVNRTKVTSESATYKVKWNSPGLTSISR